MQNTFRDRSSFLVMNDQSVWDDVRYPTSASCHISTRLVSDSHKKQHVCPPSGDEDEHVQRRLPGVTQREQSHTYTRVYLRRLIAQC